MITKISLSDIFLQNMINRFEILNVKSICSHNFAKAKKKTSQYGIQATSYEAMLQDPEIDIIVNLTPSDAHFEIIKAALSDWQQSRPGRPDRRGDLLSYSSQQESGPFTSFAPSLRVPAAASAWIMASII